jgi:hypothetical protein
MDKGRFIMPENFLIELLNHPVFFIVVAFGVFFFFILKMLLPFLKDLNLKIVEKIDGNSASIKELIVDVKKIDDDNQKQQYQINDLIVDIQKQIIYNTEISIAERIYASVKYLNSGGNGETNKYIEKNIKPMNEELYKMIETIIKEKKNAT